MTARFIVADVFEGLARLEDNSVDLVMTSPPFLALRSYLPADHPDKGREIGSEPTPAAFIDTMLDVVEALDRVLAPHGSICIELGDTYSGSGGAGGDYDADGLRAGQQKFSGSAAKRVANGIGDDYRPPRSGRAVGWPMDKSLCLIPESFRWALTYGRNPFNGRETPPWRVRNVVRWHRPHPPVGALGDKFRPSTSDVVVATKSRTRYFDLDAVRTEHRPRWFESDKPQQVTGSRADDGLQFYNHGNPAGAPPLDTWIIPTAPYKGSHYATFPPELCIIPIKAMCPLKVCRVCGEPSRRIVEHRQSDDDPRTGPPDTRPAAVEIVEGWKNGAAHHGTAANQTLGWTDCAHDDYRPGVVLDPFAGSGTTLAVATGHGRDAIGIDLDSRNADLALERVGPFILTVETPEAVA